MVAVLCGASLVSSYNGFVGLRTEMRSFRRGLDDLLRGRVIEHASESTEMEGCDTRKERTHCRPACLPALSSSSGGGADHVQADAVEVTGRWNTRLMESKVPLVPIDLPAWGDAFGGKVFARLRQLVFSHVFALCLLRGQVAGSAASRDLLIRRSLLPGSWGLVLALRDDGAHQTCSGGRPSREPCHPELSAISANGLNLATPVADRHCGVSKQGSLSISQLTSSLFHRLTMGHLASHTLKSVSSPSPYHKPSRCLQSSSRSSLGFLRKAYTA
jgi:hypothetical protein